MRNLGTILNAVILAFLLTTSFLIVSVMVPETVSAYTIRDPIHIDGDAEFTSANGVTGGSGTASDPYIIEGWDIDATTVHGIWIEDTNAHFTIRNCYVHDGGNDYIYGICLRRCVNGTVTGNDCSNNHNGIYLISSSNNTLSNNNWSFNGIGIYLYSSSNNTLSNNNCSSNNDYFGIYLTSSSNNTLSDNNCSNGLHGVYLSDSTGTTAYHNIFFDNIVNHAYDNRGSENFWNASYPIGGNYWDDYTGVDEFSGPNQDQTGSDGIGDTQYVIDANSKDYYPLMEPLPNTPPTASFTVSPSTGYVNTVFSVDASSSSDAEDDLSVLDVRWDWESDGVWDTSWSVVKTDTHQYSTEGTHTITLEVKDTKGLTDNTTREITVVPDDVPPVADAGPDQTVTVSDTVTFDGSDSSDDVGIDNYTWTFTYDDHERELYGVGPTFTFDVAGTYIVTLTVEDAEGETDEDTVTIIVEEEEEQEEDEKGFIETYGLPLGIVVALVIIALILFLVLKGRKGGKAPTSIEEPPATEPVD